MPTYLINVYFFSYQKSTIYIETTDRRGTYKKLCWLYHGEFRYMTIIKKGCDQMFCLDCKVKMLLGTVHWVCERCRKQIPISEAPFNDREQLALLGENKEKKCTP